MKGKRFNVYDVKTVGNLITINQMKCTRQLWSAKQTLESTNEKCQCNKEAKVEAEGKTQREETASTYATR